VYVTVITELFIKIKKKNKKLFGDRFISGTAGWLNQNHRIEWVGRNIKDHPFSTVTTHQIRLPRASSNRTICSIF